MFTFKQNKTGVCHDFHLAINTNFVTVYHSFLYKSPAPSLAPVAPDKCFISRMTHSHLKALIANCWAAPVSAPHPLMRLIFNDLWSSLWSWRYQDILCVSKHSLCCLWREFVKIGPSIRENVQYPQHQSFKIKCPYLLKKAGFEKKSDIKPGSVSIAI